MRRKEREVTDLNEIKDILTRAEVLRVALNNGDYPYLFPVNYGFVMDGAQLVLFFHGAKEGAKHAIIARDNKVTFEVDCGHALMQPLGEESCTSSFAYPCIWPIRSSTKSRQRPTQPSAESTTASDRFD